MNKEEIFKALNKLELDKDKYIVLSGASLVVQDIIDTTSDIDLACDKAYYDEIKWPTKIGAFNIEIKYYDIYEISNNLYDNNIIVINGYKFMNLEKCLEVKERLNRKKDLKLIRKIDLLLSEKDNYRYERKLINNNIKLICGVDEVGRGPLVGPVVAAAVILPLNYKLDGLTDSKKLSEKKREELYPIIMKDAIAVGLGKVDAKRIDEINIYEASKEAMKKAINNLKIKPEHVLVDAMKLDIDIPTTPIIHGDFISLSIAAASVIAKVTRDHMMIELDKLYPNYGFKEHKGYPTKKHLEALQKYGPLKNYRFTYGPIRDLIYKGEGSREDEIINK